MRLENRLRRLESLRPESLPDPRRDAIRADRYTLWDELSARRASESRAEAMARWLDIPPGKLVQSLRSGLVNERLQRAYAERGLVDEEL
jgi:hypothetical protein